MQQTPGQLVFGCDMIFNIKHTANYEYIRQRKQNLINKTTNVKMQDVLYMKKSYSKEEMKINMNHSIKDHLKSSKSMIMVPFV